jgi:hypothetical protein
MALATGFFWSARVGRRCRGNVRLSLPVNEAIKRPEKKAASCTNQVTIRLFCDRWHGIINEDCGMMKNQDGDVLGLKLIQVTAILGLKRTASSVFPHRPHLVIYLGR